MSRLLNFEEYSTNELFDFLSKKYEFDSRAKEVFKKLLDNIDNLEVQEFADYRREVSLSVNPKEESKEVKKKEGIEEVEVKEARTMRVPRGQKVTQTSQTSQTVTGETPSFKQKYKQGGDIKVTVMKNYSKHRTSSKIWGSGKENTFSLAINNQHFISDERGKEGKLLVNPKIVVMYWNFLSDIGNVQAKYKKRNISESEYDSEIDRIKSKYSTELSKFK
jgi:hypothetical protein